MNMPSYQLCRKISGWLFLFANIFLLVTNFSDTNFLQLTAAILFISCSLALIKSAHNHRFLYWCGLSVLIAYVLVGISNEGEGEILALAGLAAGIFTGFLDFRAGLQRETGKQYNLPYPLSLLDRYPLTSVGVVEGICCIFLFFSAILNDDARLLIASGLWICAHAFLIASDEYLRAKFA